MKAYCINLDRRPDRLEHMERQFERLGMAFERIAAVDGQAAAGAKCPADMHRYRSCKPIHE